MSTETPAAPPAADRSTELVDRLLKLPAETRLDLANLLLDSVRQGFTSLAEAEKRDREMIRSRIDQLVKGEVELLDADEVFRRIDARLAGLRNK
jgi:predicted ATPase